MIIWATIGLVGLIGGIVTVRVARRHNQPAKPAATKAPLDTAVQPSTLAGSTPVSADDVTQAA
ncbi:hypothetical protein AAE021_10550 [Arthrobacter citreus]|uniref:Uncharacterized protein n=1 Tax=Arthrobacter citreus TaxID=1670 RepID=A0ABZ2ZRB5_9MICC